MASERRLGTAPSRTAVERDDIRFLVVDDHRLFADAVARTLATMGLDGIAVATSETEALGVVERTCPEAIFVDLDLGRGSGYSLGRRVRALRPATTLVAITSVDDAPAVREAIRFGYRGFIDKRSARQEFVRSARAILDGRFSLPRRPTKDAGGPTGVGRNDDALATLTPRERQVLELLADGQSTPEIAARLTVSGHTVRSHIQNVLSKLHVHSRLGAAAYAVRHGVVTGASRDTV